MKAAILLLLLVLNVPLVAQQTVLLSAVPSQHWYKAIYACKTDSFELQTLLFENLDANKASFSLHRLRFSCFTYQKQEQEEIAEGIWETLGVRIGDESVLFGLGPKQQQFLTLSCKRASVSLLYVPQVQEPPLFFNYDTERQGCCFLFRWKENTAHATLNLVLGWSATEALVFSSSLNVSHKDVCITVERENGRFPFRLNCVLALASAPVSITVEEGIALGTEPVYGGECQRVEYHREAVLLFRFGSLGIQGECKRTCSLDEQGKRIDSNSLSLAIQHGRWKLGFIWKDGSFFTEAQMGTLVLEFSEQGKQYVLTLIHESFEVKLSYQMHTNLVVSLQYGITIDQHS